MEIKRRIVIGEETFSKRKELLRGKLDRNQKKRMIKSNAMKCYAVWITDMGYEKRRNKTIGGLRNVHMNTEKNGKKSVGLNIITNQKVLAMIGEERALIQTPRKRQRKWNQERDKEYGTDRGCYFYKNFYFISLDALVSFLSNIFPFLCKKSRNWSQGPPMAERKRQRKLSGYNYMLLFLQFYLFYFTLCIS